MSLENSDFNWRALLKSMPGAQWIIGRGVVAFNFRLLPDVMDQNGVRWESGERHVFEVVRADGWSVLLLFHKNGNCDPPEVVPSQNVAATPAAVSEHDGVEYSCRPAMQYNDIKDKVDTGDTSAPLGAAEASIALQSLLIKAFGTSDAGALNLTDEAAFSWTRYLKTTSGVGNT